MGQKIVRKPDWLKVRLPGTKEYKRVKRILASHGLHSVCQKALCPNITECFHSGTATFLILGDICTRNCRYCNIRSGMPTKIDTEEPERLAEAVSDLDLRYIVITSVTRDDLPDGGSHIFARTVSLLRQRNPRCEIEVLIPDFRGNREALECVVEAGPDVVNHNIEVVKSLFSNLRPHGDYDVSLEVLRRVRDRENGPVSKSGFMIGLGESDDDILGVLRDLASVGCERVTIGQYQQPTRNHWPVNKYYHPDEFSVFKAAAFRLGFRSVEAGPLVRSSYHAALMK